MGKIENIKAVVDLAKVVVDAGIALADARRRSRAEAEARQESEKDKRIKELEAQLAATSKP